MPYSFLPLSVWVLFQKAIGLLQVPCHVYQTCADSVDTLGLLRWH